MHYYEVAPNQIIRQDSRVFTYASAEPLKVGHIVAIEIGRKQAIGVVMREVTEPTYATKPISALIEPTPLPTHLPYVATWLADYYGTHLALALQVILPRGIQKKRRERAAVLKETVRSRTTIVLNKYQSGATKNLNEMPSGTLLLHGVTGSGKTAVYVEAAKQTLAAGRSVIVLVPEIALTSQVVDEFSHHFDNIILTHSRQSEAERHIAWREALTSTTPRVIIGPRSALFMPIKDPGLIIIDEAHEPSFKQEQSPRYSALRAASIIADATTGKVVLGSATPLISDYYMALSTGRPLISMPDRAKDGAVLPSVSVIDMTKRPNFTKHRFFSDKLLAEITATLDRGEQVLLFHNRRGSASTTLCENCGWSASCPRCFLPLTLHADQHLLRCHMCNHTERVPTSCPVCGSVDITHKGIGTKLIESELHKLYPGKTIARFDGDTENGTTVESRYKELYEGTIDIIVGTQVVAKGLDLPQLRIVGVIQADAGLALPDFAAPERTFQLLAQVVGRVGRSHHATSVVVQSYQPTHYAVTTGLKQDYQQFYDLAIAERKRTHFPPFTFLLRLTCSYKTEAAAIRNAQQLAKTLRSAAPSTIMLFGPTPAFYERQRDSYRWQIIVKSPKRSDLVSLLKHLPPTHWQFELDPTSLI